MCLMAGNLSNCDPMSVWRQGEQAAHPLSYFVVPSVARIIPTCRGRIPLINCSPLLPII